MKLSGWGLFPKIDAQCCAFETQKGLHKCLQEGRDCIVHGLGRSYGDSSLNDRVILTKRFDKILEFDEGNGIITCESGASLADIIDAFLPRGWFLRVTPGTKFVTVGGAIASDVHGKNHHKVGCFSSCVESFELMVSDGEILWCSREENRDFFLSTCGGMGLTGIILSAKIRLKRVRSAYIRRRIIRASSLEEVFELFEQYAGCSYSVAWIDCLAKGKKMGRSLFILGEHADDGVFVVPEKKKFSVPFEFPGFFINKCSLSLLNALYFHIIGKCETEDIITFDRFFYPLDEIHNWNRLYGSKGFTQYQLVIPKENGFEGIVEILNRISDSGLGSFLAVLKLLGAENGNYLSFPMEGYTLALDFKIEPKLFPLLDALDEIVLKYGGRIYLAKDVRLTPEMFEQGYPGLEAFRKVRREYGLERKFQSMQSKRLRL
ncbi:MAG: FAD-binding oxidoreductase [Desulfobacteraceae bacterium]|nr:FAD-binding oxidoreductase [Desulfobacteraceae bacterium]